MEQCLFHFSFQFFSKLQAPKNLKHRSKGWKIFCFQSAWSFKFKWETGTTTILRFCLNMSSDCFFCSGLLSWLLLLCLSVSGLTLSLSIGSCVLLAFTLVTLNCFWNYILLTLWQNILKKTTHCSLAVQWPCSVFSSNLWILCETTRWLLSLFTSHQTLIINIFP